MKSIGVVGHEAAKFTSETEEKAREYIRYLIGGYDRIVSGACHLGGIDVWAIEEAKKLGKVTLEFPPKKKTWEGGYKERNLQIAHASDKVVCIVVKEYPWTYKGMKFDYCYHCDKNNHIKSGGCWTMKKAASLGKDTELIIID